MVSSRRNLADATERCAGCGLVLAGGEAACQELFEAEGARHVTDVRLAGSHRAEVDAYALQHPDRYCASAISLAAHLTGVCVAVEHPDHPSINALIQRWLNTRPTLTKPLLPLERGLVTINEIAQAPDPEAHRLAVDRWLRSTWDAYGSLQPIAREWIAPLLR